MALAGVIIANIAINIIAYRCTTHIGHGSKPTTCCK